MFDTYCCIVASGGKYERKKRMQFVVSGDDEFEYKEVAKYKDKCKKSETKGAAAILL